MADVQTRGIGVGGTGGICCGSLKIAFAYPRCCCLDCRSAVLRQPSGRLIGIEVMLRAVCGLATFVNDGSEAALITNLKSGVEHRKLVVVCDWPICS